ncbi:MAG: DUF4132 domain-containing protein [Polyangiaceae bacterium]
MSSRRARHASVLSTAIPASSSTTEGFSSDLLAQLSSVAIPSPNDTSDTLPSLDWPEALLAVAEQCSAEYGAKLAYELSEQYFEAGCPTPSSFVLLAGGLFPSVELLQLWHDEYCTGNLPPRTVLRMALVAGYLRAQDQPAVLAEALRLLRRISFRAARASGQAWAQGYLDATRADWNVDDSSYGLLTLSHSGFRQDGRRVFTLGARSYVLTIKGPGELSVVDDHARPMKHVALPSNVGAAGKHGVVERARFDEARTAALEGSRRIASDLEEEMRSGVARPWALWKRIFTNNPIISSTVRPLVWVARRPEQPDCYFRLDEERQYISHHNEVMGPFPGAMIQLAHSSLMTEEERFAWRHHLAEYLLVPPFEQIEHESMSPRDPRYSQEFGAIDWNDTHSFCSSYGWKLMLPAASGAGSISKTVWGGKIRVYFDIVREKPNDYYSAHKITGFRFAVETPLANAAIVPSTETILRCEALTELYEGLSSEPEARP